jgi:hypothetical protein
MGAARSKDRRARARKRRPSPSPQSAGETAASAGKSGGGAATATREPAPRPRATQGSPRALTYGARPHAPWHPLPLSELLILVGAVFVVLGVRRLNAGHPELAQGATLLAGLGAVAIGTFEFALREHRSGYRSHTTLLALLPVLAFDTLVVLVVSAFTKAPRLLNVALLAIDIGLFAVLFRLLRARFLDARHARVLREG